MNDRHLIEALANVDKLKELTDAFEKDAWPAVNRFGDQQTVDLLRKAIDLLTDQQLALAEMKLYARYLLRIRGGQEIGR